MATLRAFNGLRPPKEIVKLLASRPYDVLNSEEARVEADGNPYSLLHVIKPEIDLPEGINLYSQEVYDKAKSNFEEFKSKGWLTPDDQKSLYIYGQTMFGKTQYGIVGCASVDDYMNNVIKKTRTYPTGQGRGQNETCAHYQCQHGACFLFLSCHGGYR